MNAVLLINILIGFVTGLLVLRANPRRSINLAFSAVFLILTLWHFCVYRILSFAESPNVSFSDKLFWLRANTIVIAWLPLAVWWLKQSIITTGRRTITLSQASPWIVIAIILASLSFSETAFLPNKPSEAFGRGTAYFAFIAIEVCAYSVIIGQACFALKELTGTPRIQLQLLALLLSAASLTASLVNGIGSYFGILAIKLATFPVALAFLALCAWSICVYRIFSIREITLAVVHRAIGVSATIAGVLLLEPFFRDIPDRRIAVTIGAALSCTAAFWLDRRLYSLLDIGGARLLGRMRATILSSAKTEPHLELMVKQFEAHLCKWCNSVFALVLHDDCPSSRADQFASIASWSDHDMLIRYGWATPESLERRRSKHASDELRTFLIKRELGLIVTVPPGTERPSLILAIGRKSDDSPFTYPEIERLQNVAELMDNIITRSRLTAQAALHARMEHLAMMSRGLAHDLKNLITPVSSFLVHTDSRFAPETVEGEVHAAAQRSVRIMSDYVREALFFAERLAPKFERVDLSRLCETVRDITAERARRRNVSLGLPTQFPSPIIADDVLLQRMLGNLVANAIDASSSGGHVTLSIEPTRRDFVQFKIVDRGSGIAPDHLSRIFDAYFTTKEFGDDVRGFGLGLTISRKIADLHRGTIHVESQLGVGTTFTVELPIAQLIGTPTAARDASFDVSARAALDLTPYDPRNAPAS